jgi:beta-lactamase class A
MEQRRKNDRLEFLVHLGGKLKAVLLNRRSLIIIGGILGVLLVIQLLWPSGRSRPFVKVGGTRMGLASKEQMASKLNGVTDSSKLDITFKDKKQSVAFKELGITLKSEESAKNGLKYQWWKRIIPLSLITFNNVKAETNIDRTKLETKVKELVDKQYKAPFNATVKINNVTAELVQAADGHRFDQAKVSDTFAKLTPAGSRQSIKLKAETIKPVRPDDKVKDLVKDAQRAIDTPLTLKFADKQEQPSKQVIAGWLKFVESKDKKLLSIDLDAAKVKEHTDPLAKSIYIAPGVTTVNYVDGKETSRQVGSNGRGLDTEKSTEVIKQALLNKKVDSATLTVSVLPPRIQNNRAYTSSQAGLQALLADLAKDNGDYAISVIDFSGSGWSASANGGKTYHPASTYKTYVAYSLLKRVDSGEIKLDESATAGKNIDQCLEVMIVRSDNACAEWLGGTKLKWSTVTSDVRALGLSSGTNLNNSFISTTYDEALFMQKLSGSILKDESRDKLLGLMRRQIYRAGIPAGVVGTVADKVGFLNGLLHDQAIVYGRKRTYALVIFSNGSSWGTIAKVSKAIDEFMSR